MKNLFYMVEKEIRGDQNPQKEVHVPSAHTLSNPPE